MGRINQWLSVLPRTLQWDPKSTVGNMDQWFGTPTSSGAWLDQQPSPVGGFSRIMNNLWAFSHQTTCCLNPRDEPPGWSKRWTTRDEQPTEQPCEEMKQQRRITHQRTSWGNDPWGRHDGTGRKMGMDFPMLWVPCTLSVPSSTMKYFLVLLLIKYLPWIFWLSAWPATMAAVRNCRLQSMAVGSRGIHRNWSSLQLGPSGRSEELDRPLLSAYRLTTSTMDRCEAWTGLIHQ